VALPDQSTPEPAGAKGDGVGSRRAEQHEPMRPTDWVRVGLPIIALAVFVILAWRHGYFDLKNPAKLEGAAQRVQEIPWLGPIFVTVYALLATFAAPVSPLAYGAGAVFGLVRGTVYVMIASLLGAAGGYYLARSAWSGVARRLLGRFHDRMREMRGASVFVTTLRIQLLPVMPFGIFNYAAGVADFAFLPFIAGTAVGILPGTIAAVYVGDRIMAGITGSDKRAFIVAGAIVMALFALSFAPTLIKRLRRRERG
jgi:uncharacterized membrane protein YdjX (TVP38/TMEM64 family)